MSMTLTQIRTYVRAVPDIDTDDLDPTTLDLFIQEGFDRIASSERTWDFYQSHDELSTVNGTQSYALASLGDDPLADITTIKGVSRLLKPAPHQSAIHAYRSSSVVVAGEPRSWSLWADSLYLWPVPNGIYELDVYGYRQPNDWIADGAGSTPDLPSDMHNLVALWALARAYEQQDDIEMAERKQSVFDNLFSVLREKYIGDGPAVPLVLNGGSRQLEATSPWPRFTWEV